VNATTSYFSSKAERYDAHQAEHKTSVEVASSKQEFSRKIAGCLRNKSGKPRDKHGSLFFRHGKNNGLTNKFPRLSVMRGTQAGPLFRALSNGSGYALDTANGRGRSMPP
jgi:hypothetical protein